MVQPGAGSHQDGEGLGRDLHIEGAVIALGHIVETGALVGQQAHEDVHPAGRGLGIGPGDQALGQVQPLLKAHDIDAALFQHDPGVGDHDPVHGHVGDPFLDLAPAGQEGGAHAPGLVRQAQVQAGGLDLVMIEGGVGRDGAGGDQGLDGLGGQDAGTGRLEGTHGVSLTRFSRPVAKSRLRPARGGASI